MLVLVLLTAAVVPNLQAKAVAGRPTLGAVPPPPHIGQCLLQNPPDPSVLVSAQQSYRLGDCAGLHYGEVALVTVPAPARQSSTGTGTDIGTIAVDPCADISEYLGWKPPVASTPNVSWEPISVAVISMVPVALQSAFGQHWVACVVTPGISGASYSGSVQHALRTGKVPTAFASCHLSLTPDRTGLVDCRQPHGFEIFGYARLRDGYHDQRVLDLDCRKIAATAMGRADPSAGGRLTISAVPFYRDAAGNSQAGYPVVAPGAAGTAAARGTAEAGCTVGVTGSRRLVGSLYGLGEKPLPLS